MGVSLIADVHERPSGIPDLLVQLGIEVDVRSLEDGDYLVARGVLVERKSVLDLHMSVVAGTFWRQIGRLRKASARPYLLIEGLNIDRGALAPNGVRGVCLAVIEQGIPILRTTSALDSALWLSRVATRAQVVRARPDRPVYDQRKSPPDWFVSESVLAAVPGISVTLARRLLDRFGSVAAVMAADPVELTAVEGVGARRVSALVAAFHTGRGRPPAT